MQSMRMLLLWAVGICLACTRPNSTYVPDGMVEVPAGTFVMGTAEPGPSSPAHEQKVDRFYLDQTEVTVGAYRACVATGACSRPMGGDPCNWTEDMEAGKDNLPVNCVTWHQAVDYCGWKRRRLPTEIEWEYAARGTRGSKYPWGDDEPDTDKHSETKLCWKTMPHRTCPVGSYSATLLGKPEMGGLYDMAGNVYEWTASIFCPYPLDPKDPTCGMDSDKSPRVERGGSYGDGDPVFVRPVRRNYDVPTSRPDPVGFRCAATP